MPTIVDKQRTLKVQQLSTVAERRFRDAESLVATDNNERAAGAMYLCGFVLEVLLKAQLIRNHPFVGKERSNERQLSKQDLETWSLVWRSHDLERLLSKLPQLEVALHAEGRRSGRAYVASLKKLCSTWTVYARYSSQSSTTAEAQRMVNEVRALKEVMK